MQHVRARQGRVLAIAAGILLLVASTSFAQCMPGGRGMAAAGSGMMGGPRMMGMSATGPAASSGGASLMSLQQAMQMAQMVQQMRTMQIERLRMLEAQRNRQTAQPPRNRRSANRQAAQMKAFPSTEQLAANSPQGSKSELEPNANSASSRTNPATGRTLRNRPVAAKRPQ